MSQTLTVTITAVASSIDAATPAMVVDTIRYVANAIDVDGVPVGATGSGTFVLNEISKAITWTVAKS
jgi:hypothetical protein